MNESEFSAYYNFSWKSDDWFVSLIYTRHVIKCHSRNLVVFIISKAKQVKSA